MQKKTDLSADGATEKYYSSDASGLSISGGGSTTGSNDSAAVDCRTSTSRMSTKELPRIPNAQ